MNNSNRLSVRTRLLMFGAVTVVLTAALGGFSFSMIRGFHQTTAELVISSHALRNHLEADMMHDAVRADVISVLVASSASERAEVHKDLEEHLKIFHKAMERNKQLLLSPAIQKALSDIEPELNRYADSAAHMFDLANSSHAAAQAQYAEFLKAFEALEIRNSNASDLIQKSVGETEKAQGEAFASGVRTIIFVVMLSICVAGILSWFVARNVTTVLRGLEGQLKVMAESLTTAASGVASASGAIAAGASFQAQSVSSVAEYSEQASNSAKSNAAQCRKSTALMEQLSSKASGSQVAVNQLNEAMEAIAQSSGRVSKIVKQIEEIAFQTNLLALNASVEAARAGDAGAGFAVVADEVRNLARRSTEAAKETAQLIEESAGLSAEGSERAGQVASAIHTLIEDFQQVRTAIEVIDRSSQEQTAGTEQISSSVMKIQDITQRNAASAEQNAAVSRELEGQAKSLDKVVEELRALAR